MTTREHRNVTNTIIMIRVVNNLPFARDEGPLLETCSSAKKNKDTMKGLDVNYYKINDNGCRD